MLGDDLFSIADSLGWHRFSVGGVSLGGMIATQAAITVPDRIEHLLVCSASPKMPMPAAEWNRRIAAVKDLGMGGFLDGMIERMFSTEYRNQRPTEIDSLGTVFSFMDPNGYASSLAALRDVDLIPLLPQVKSPTLFMTGSRDQLIGEEARAAFAAGILNLRHIELDSGHYPMLENPAEFRDVATQFFKTTQAKTD
jgi:pimeloyl-ACP methyl ester carboxylesterase